MVQYPGGGGGGYILYMISRYLLPFIHQSHVTVRSLPVLLYNRFWVMWTVQSPEIVETMSLEIKIWQWICDTQYECMNIKQSLCLRCLHWCVFPRIPIIWHHDKVVRQRRSCATSHHSNITTVWLLQHLVSDRLLSLISKEIVHLMLDKDFLFYFKTIDKLFVNLCLNLLYYLICRLKYGV